MTRGRRVEEDRRGIFVFLYLAVLTVKEEQISENDVCVYNKKKIMRVSYWLVLLLIISFFNDLKCERNAAFLTRRREDPLSIRFCKETESLEFLSFSLIFVFWNF